MIYTNELDIQVICILADVREGGFVGQDDFDLVEEWLRESRGSQNSISIENDIQRLLPGIYNEYMNKKESST